MQPEQQRALSRLGLKTSQLQLLLSKHPGAMTLRVSAVDRGLCTVIQLGEDGSLQQRRVRPSAEAVAVGDFVLIDQSDPPAITHILPRTTVLRRGAAANEGKAQLIAANLDVVFVVSAFAPTEKLSRRGLQARRIERYVAAVREGGSIAVAVLNKVDVAALERSALDDLRKALSSRLHDVDVICTSAETGEGLDSIARYLTPGTTVGFIGMSGVGKSSLINALLQESAQRVRETRGVDDKGRHTTTRRELRAMPSGAWLVDTPGMREFALLSEDEEIAGFDDIDQLAQRCRYTDCGHETEPDCAVRAAVEAGTLDADRLANYQALHRDAKRIAAKHDARARQEQHRHDRIFGRMVRDAVRRKR